jgi:hypothetical protein
LEKNQPDALAGRRFTKSTFNGREVQIEELVPASVRTELKALGHDIQPIPRRTPTLGKR